MRKPAVIALIALAVVLLGAAAVLFQKYRQADSDYRAMRALEAETRGRYGAAIGEIAAIQDSLNSIVLGDAGADLRPTDLVAESRLMETRGDLALARVAVLKAGIERTRRRIEELDETLRTSGVRIAGLERIVDNLRRSVARKEEEIAQLSGERDALRSRVTGLAAEIAMREDSLSAQAAALEQRRLEISTIWYAFGTRKELLSSGLAVASGGVLGIGRTLEPSGKFEPALFTAVDTDRHSVIRIPARRAQVLSAQPEGSYTLQPVEGGVDLVILDPTGFRHVKHVLIVTS
jgi:hypothetical protein